MLSALGNAAIGLLIGLALSGALIRWVAPLGWMDHPSESRKHHDRPTPRTGGMVLWLGLVLSQALGLNPFRLTPVEWAAVHAMAFTGLVDDRLNLRARYKAAVGLGVAVLLAWHVAVTLGPSVAEVPFLGIELPTHPALLIPLLALWFWALPQMYNLIDGLNGLSVGYAVLLTGVLGYNLAVPPAYVWGGLLAVLALNYPKARHFLGDCGALLLGTLFGILGVKAFGSRDPNLLFWVFAYPIADVSLVVGIRKWKGLPFSHADRSHLHHWMLDRMGRRPWLAPLALLLVAGLPMLRATRVPGHTLLSLLGVLGLGLLTLKAFKDRVHFPREREAKDAARVRREIPAMIPSPLHDSSGAHSRL